MERANARSSGLSLLELAELEKAVKTAAPCQAPIPAAAVASPSAAQQEDGPADFGRLRPYLDEAGIGEPTRKGIPSTSVFNAAVAAAGKHTVPAADAIEPGQFPKHLSSRPLAAWMLDASRQFWANVITGVAGVGDCFNRISNAALVATDVRYSAAVVEKAAVRYDAARLNEVSLDALKARSGADVRELYRTACSDFDKELAHRCLEEEKAGSTESSGRQAPWLRPPSNQAAKKPANDALVTAFADGAEVCIIWGFGKCQRGDNCAKAHVCPVCGSKERA
jgi:hypothetical protein